MKWLVILGISLLIIVCALGLSVVFQYIPQPLPSKPEKIQEIYDFRDLFLPIEQAAEDEEQELEEAVKGNFYIISFIIKDIKEGPLYGGISLHGNNELTDGTVSQIHVTLKSKETAKALKLNKGDKAIVIAKFKEHDRFSGYYFDDGEMVG